MKRSFVVCLVCVALTFPALANSARASEPVKITATHPLEPLSALEMKAAYEIVKARASRATLTSRISCDFRCWS